MQQHPNRIGVFYFLHSPTLECTPNCIAKLGSLLQMFRVIPFVIQESVCWGCDSSGTTIYPLPKKEDRLFILPVIAKFG